MEEKIKETPYRLHLMVCAGTACVSNHSFDVKEALEAEIKKHGLEDEILVFEPTGRGIGNSPFNLNCWKTVRGEPIK